MTAGPRGPHQGTPRPYYEQDGITIYHGDCETVLPELGLVGLVVTSPPYNLKKRWWDSGANGIHKTLAAKFADEWYPDEREEGDYQAWQRRVIDRCLELAPLVCYNHKVRYAFKREGRAFHPMEWLQGLPLWVEIIWNKGGGPALNCSRPVVADERIFVLGKPTRWNNLGFTNVWNLRPEASEHPCPFPVELASRCIAMFTEPWQTVLDPFMGSGSTLLAAKNLSRGAIGIEIEERYCEIAARRLDQTVLAL